MTTAAACVPTLHREPFDFHREVDEFAPADRRRTASSGDLLAAGERIGMLRAGGFEHFLRTSKEELVPLHFHPLLVGAELAGVDAQQNILGSASSRRT